MIILWVLLREGLGQTRYDLVLVQVWLDRRNARNGQQRLPVRVLLIFHRDGLLLERQQCFQGLLGHVSETLTDLCLEKGRRGARLKAENTRPVCFVLGALQKKHKLYKLTLGRQHDVLFQ